MSSGNESSNDFDLINSNCMKLRDFVHFYTQVKAADRRVQRGAVKQRSRDRANENQVLGAFLARLFETLLPTGLPKNWGVSKTRGWGLSLFSFSFFFF